MGDTEEIRAELRGLANPGKARQLQRFFKTGPGQYGEGDFFLGITVPESRKVADRHSSCDLQTVQDLLRSPAHEERLVGLLILVHKYCAGEKGVAEFYLDNLSSVNNWDLVDLSAPNIVGAHLASRDRSLLYRLARSESVWERRIAVVATFHFIRNGQFEDTLRIAEMLMADKHDLIHKATGWMLREAGKRDTAALEEFLERNCRRMPRTMLRYAVERLPERRRKHYMGTVARRNTE